MHQIPDGGHKVATVVVECEPNACAEVYVALRLQIDENFDHLQSFELLTLAHRIELLEEARSIFPEGLILLWCKLKVIREVRLLGELNTMKGQIWETAKRAHG